ncbi:MAG: hypothetical protein D6737_14560, partial [Chloroflexi bacterium]
FETILSDTNQNHLLRKISLSVENNQHEELLRQLFIRHISLAHVMPTLDNVSKTLFANLELKQSLQKHKRVDGSY